MPNPKPDLDTRFKNHPPRGTAASRHDEIRDMMKAAAHSVLDFVPPGREQAVALTKIEEAMFWANAGIARGISAPKPLKHGGGPCRESNVSDTHRDRRQP
jgi:hypothetical protein